MNNPANVLSPLSLSRSLSLSNSKCIYLRPNLGEEGRVANKYVNIYQRIYKYVIYKWTQI